MPDALVGPWEVCHYSVSAVGEALWLVYIVNLVCLDTHGFFITACTVKTDLS